jgi:hypothetical protein
MAGTPRFLLGFFYEGKPAETRHPFVGEAWREALPGQGAGEFRKPARDAGGLAFQKN